MNIDETKQYYGPGGDFIPFSGVEYRDFPSSYDFFMREKVRLLTGWGTQDAYDHVHGVLMGRITRNIVGFGLVETFIIELPDNTRRIVGRQEFTKVDMTARQNKMWYASRGFSGPSDYYEAKRQGMEYKMFDSHLER